jgi:hypothetical protein
VGNSRPGVLAKKLRRCEEEGGRSRVGRGGPVTPSPLPPTPTVNFARTPAVNYAGRGLAGSSSGIPVEFLCCKDTLVKSRGEPCPCSCTHRCTIVDRYRVSVPSVCVNLTAGSNTYAGQSSDWPANHLYVWKNNIQSDDWLASWLTGIAVFEPLVVTYFRRDTRDKRSLVDGRDVQLVIFL